MGNSLEYLTLSDLDLLKDMVREISKDVNGRILINEPMSGHTSFRIGGPARLYVIPRSVEDLSKLIMVCVSQRIRYSIIGFGTNLLVSDAGYDGCVIDLAEACREINIKDESLWAGAGMWGNDIVRKAAENGLAGIENLSGIPGGLGGWVKMNCGAFGSAISDYLVSVKVMSGDGTSYSIGRNMVGFSYRSSPGLSGTIILGAEFRLNRGKKEKLLKTVEEIIAERYRRNIMTLPSAGSLFKNPKNGYAAKLIESVGGKGMQFGGMEISQSHANFAINTRGGCADDVVKLIRKIKTLVFDKHNVELELELQLLGFKNEI